MNLTEVGIDQYMNRLEKRKQADLLIQGAGASVFSYRNSIRYYLTYQDMLKNGYEFEEVIHISEKYSMLNIPIGNTSIESIDELI
jgi:hypothetical protein